MPTLTLLPSTAIDPDKGLAQLPQEALDLDGYDEVGLFLRVDGWQSGSSTLDVTIAHAARNGEADRLELRTVKMNGASANGLSTFSYDSSFLRYLSVKAEWSPAAPSTNGAMLEILACPKKS